MMCSAQWLNNCASHSRYFSDELDAQIFYSKKERTFTGLPLSEQLANKPEKSNSSITFLGYRLDRR